MAYDTEYFQGKSVDEKHERAYWRRIGVEVVAILIAAFLLGSALYAGKVYAGPRVYSPQECGIAPIELAEAFAQDCQNNRGNLDPIFGTAL